MYASLLEEAKSSPPPDCRRSLDDIEKDLFRTFPTHPAFREATVTTSTLRNILSAFIVANPQVGYWQGMNSLAGFLLLLCNQSDPSLEPRDCADPEERAFWLLQALTTKILPPAFLGSRPDLNLGPCEGIHKALETVSNLVSRKHSRFISTLEANGLDLSTDVVLQWLPRLFVGCLPSESTLRVWDLIFTSGAGMIYRSAAALVALQAEAISRIHPNDGEAGVWEILKNVPSKLYFAESLISRVLASMTPRTPERPPLDLISPRGVSKPRSPTQTRSTSKEDSAWFQRYKAETNARISNLEARELSLLEGLDSRVAGLQSAFEDRIASLEASLLEATEKQADLTLTVKNIRSDLKIEQEKNDNLQAQIAVLSEGKEQQRKETTRPAPKTPEPKTPEPKTPEPKTPEPKTPELTVMESEQVDKVVMRQKRSPSQLKSPGTSPSNLPSLSLGKVAQISGAKTARSEGKAGESSGGRKEQLTARDTRIAEVALRRTQAKKSEVSTPSPSEKKTPTKMSTVASLRPPSAAMTPRSTRAQGMRQKAGETKRSCSKPKNNAEVWGPGGPIEERELSQVIRVTCLQDKSIRRYLQLALVSQIWRGASTIALQGLCANVSAEIEVGSSAGWRKDCGQVESRMLDALIDLDGVTIQAQAKAVLSTSGYGGGVGQDVKTIIAVAQVLRNDCSALGLDWNGVRLKMLQGGVEGLRSPLNNGMNSAGGPLANTGGGLLASLRAVNVEGLAQVLPKQWELVEEVVGLVVDKGTSALTAALQPWLKVILEIREGIKEHTIELGRLSAMRRKLPGLLLAVEMKQLKQGLRFALYASPPQWSRFLQACTVEDVPTLLVLRSHRKVPVVERKAFTSTLARYHAEYIETSLATLATY